MTRPLRAGRAFVVALCVALGAGALAAGTTAVARTGAGFIPCRARHLHVGELPVSNLRVSGLSCNGAIAVLQAATFAPTPGGPMFSMRGFRCTGPVGPPPPGEEPRFYTCTRTAERFEFLVPGFS